MKKNIGHLVPECPFKSSKQSFHTEENLEAAHLKFWWRLLGITWRMKYEMKQSGCKQDWKWWILSSRKKIEMVRACFVMWDDTILIESQEVQEGTGLTPYVKTWKTVDVAWEAQHIWSPKKNGIEAWPNVSAIQDELKFSGLLYQVGD